VLGGRLLFPARTAAFLGLTLGYYVGYEAKSGASPERRIEILESLKRTYGPRMLSVYGVHPIIGGPGLDEEGYLRGTDERGLGRIFVMNHRSGLDILLTVAFIEAGHISRADLARWPFVGRVARRIGTLFVDRESKASGAAVLHAMSRSIREGRGLVVFAEGTTYDGDEVRAFRPGAFSTARRTGAEVVPIGVAYGGSGASFGDESFLAHMRRVSATPRLGVAMLAGEPIKTEGLTTQEITKRSHESVQALVHRARERVGG
jgi:1-acyl-sn-glycerol-3-phosphate acyltransferase